MKGHALERAGRRNLRQEGTLAEDIACRYIEEQGYRILERNFRFRRKGEIDIVARDGDDLVFCEVKARRSRSYGLPEEAVTHAKRQTIRGVAAAYLALRGIGDTPCRFDVIAVQWQDDVPAVTLLKNAF